MTLTLVDDVNSTDTRWRMTDSGNTLPGLVYPCLATIGSEQVEINGFGYPGSLEGIFNVSVSRRRNNTSAASHLAGGALSPTILGAGGAGLDVTDGTTTVAGAASLHLPSGTVTDLGGGEAGASAPTLAAVLAAGNDVAGKLIVSADFSADITGAVILLNTAEADTPGAIVLRGGENTTAAGGAALNVYGASSATEGGFAQLIAGVGDAVNGAEIGVNGGTTGQPGRAMIYSDGTFGGNGQVLTSDGSYALWQSLLTSGAGAPGSSFVSLLYFDTTASSGGLYAWNGSAYAKVGLATT